MLPVCTAPLPTGGLGDSGTFTASAETCKETKNRDAHLSTSVFHTEYNVAFGGNAVFFALKAFSRSHLFQASLKVWVQNALGLYSTKE